MFSRFALLFLLVLIVVFPVFAGVGDQLLSNGGFEIDANADSIPDGWSAVGGTLVCPSDCRYRFDSNGTTQSITQSFEYALGVSNQPRVFTYSVTLYGKDGYNGETRLKIKVDGVHVVNLLVENPSSTGTVVTGTFSIPGDQWITYHLFDVKVTSAGTVGRLLVDDTSLVWTQ
jgi:hypothetical protein